MSAAGLHIRAQGGRAGPILPIEARGQWRLAWRRLLHDRAAVASAAVILIMAALALAAPAFAALTGHGAAQQFPGHGLSPSGAPVGPSATFWLGTDDLGRDLFVRLLYGARISLFVGVVTTAIGTVLGVGAGLAAGYFGGVIDTVLARLVDAVLAFPYIMLALALAAVFGPSLPVVIGVISFFAWSGIARVVRGQAVSLREREYVEAARALGAGPWRIMFSEILPNLAGPVLVLATLAVPSAIIFEATLSFLGLGVQPPTASWGNIIAGAQANVTGAWWYLLFPTLALLLTTLAFNLLGDGIRDALDPAAERLLAGAGRRGRRRLRWLRRAAPAAATSAPAATEQAQRCITAPAQPRAARAPESAAGQQPVITRLARHLRGWPAMLAFLLRRTLTGAVVLWVVSLATFALFFTRPAISVARSMTGKEVTAAQLRQITRQLGLDQPVAAQYWHFLDRLLHGNLGYSYLTGEPVTAILARDLPPTASLVAGAAALWLLAGISVGVLSATRARGLFDRLATVGVLAGLSLPTFVLGLLLLRGVFLQLNLHGFHWIQNQYAGPSQGLLAWAGRLILPWITLATVSAAVYSRLSRGSLLETLGEDYIRTARAKGLSERRVVLRHALRSALTPVVSQLGIDVGTLLGGVVVTENVFSIPGIGAESVHAIAIGDLPVIIGLVLAAAAFVVVANIVVDFGYTLLDPRVRLT